MSTHANYGEKSYWDERYGGANLDIYEWYMSWAVLKSDILKFVHSSHPVVPASGGAPASPTSPDSIATTDANSISPASQPTASPASTTSTSLAATTAAASSIVSQPPAKSESQRTCSACQQSKYLIVGCGNSELSAHMFQDGFTNLRSVDYSEVVITKMKTMYASTPALASSFSVGDCRALNTVTFPDDSLDVIIDKGTLDAILCGADSNRHQQAMIVEMHRVLRRGGVFIIITYGQPNARLPYLEKTRYDWTVNHIALGPTRFMYVCKKR